MSTTNHNPALSGRIIPTFFYYVVPSTIGLIAITTANLVDGIFVGNFVGAKALAVITLLVPYFTLLIAIALMIAIGGSVSAGKAIGKGKPQEASALFSQSLMAVFLVISLFALLSAHYDLALYRLLAIPQDLQPMAKEYFDIIRWVFIVQLFTMVLYYFVRADGHPVLATSALVVGALSNIGLDAWFVMHWQLGLAGAAYATAIAQALQLLILSRYFFSPSRTLSFSLLQKSWSRFAFSVYNGVSEFVNELSIGLIFLLLNSLLMATSGPNGIAAFSVANYFIFLSVMLCYGIADALHLLASQNYGAGKHERIEKFLNTALCSTLAIGLALIAALFLWQETVIHWFLDKEDAAIATMTAELLGLLWPLFLVNGSNIILSCYLTAIHQAMPSALIAMTRSLILPACFLLFFYFLWDHLQAFGPLNSNANFLIALPLAEWCTFFLAVFFYFRYKPSLLHCRPN